MPEAIQQLLNFIEAHPWIAITFALIGFFASNLFGSWAKLTKQYATQKQFAGQKWRFEVVTVGNVKYNSCITVGSNSEGLYLSPFIILRLGYPAILIPWENLRLKTEERLFERVHFLEANGFTEIKIIIHDRLLSRISQASQGKFSAQDEKAPELPASSEPVNTSTQFSTRLFLKIFALTFALGLALGMFDHGLAQYQAWRYPERYSLYSLEEYTSPRYGNEGPNMDLELLGLTRPIRVKVEQQNEVLVSESYYSIFGAIHQAKYKYGTWYWSGGGRIFSTPLYTANCFLPLIIGWIGSFIYSKKLDRLSRSRTNPQAAVKARATLAILFHSGIMGFASMFLLYLIPNVIITAFIDLLSYQG